jgi:hypothetical protein
VADAPDAAVPVDPAYGEILPPEVLSRLNVSAARTLIGRLVRGGDVSPELLTLVDGPLADAVSKAADYAGKSLAPGDGRHLQGRLERFCPVGARERGQSDGAPLW